MSKIKKGEIVEGSIIESLAHPTKGTQYRITGVDEPRYFCDGAYTMYRGESVDPSAEYRWLGGVTLNHINRYFKLVATEKEVTNG